MASAAVAAAEPALQNDDAKLVFAGWTVAATAAMLWPGSVCGADQFSRSACAGSMRVARHAGNAAAAVAVSSSTAHAAT